GTYGGHAYKGKCRSAGDNYDGYLYNWEAAMNNFTAVYGDTYVAHDSSNAFSNGTTLATHDICPLGWHVPKRTEFQAGADSVQGSSVANRCTSSDCAISWNFFRTAGANGWNATAKSTIAGNSSGGLNNQGSNASWWSSSLYSSAYAYDIGLASNLISPQNHSYKYYGFSVRCLADY
ncbi:hypothetical protein IJJ12_01940, partial [bacterium]|nr:hypothetical protein [bacterium]